MFFRHHPYKRKYKFIDKKQQVRFAVDVALHSLLFPVMLLILMMVRPYSTWLLGKDAATLQPILRDFYMISVDHWWVIAIALLFVAVFSVLFSHRVFGPMRRFENALRRRREHPDQPIRCNLRNGDYFHEFSHLLEEVVNGTPAADSNTPTAVKESR